MASKRLYKWKNYLRKHYATTKNEDLAETIGVSIATIRRWAKLLGLRKVRRRHRPKTHYERFDDPRYQQWRLAVLRKSDFKCTRCGLPARNREHGWGLDCHHIQSWAKHPLLRYTVSNGIALCRNCHVYTHEKEGWQ